MALGMPGTSRARLLEMIFSPWSRFAGIGSDSSAVVYVVEATQELKDFCAQNILFVPTPYQSRQVRWTFPPQHVNGREPGFFRFSHRLEHIEGAAFTRVPSKNSISVRANTRFYRNVDKLGE